MALQLDFRYPVASWFGVARLVQVILGIIVLICIGVADYAPVGQGFIYFVAVASLITSLVFLILYVIHLPESGPFAKIPWSIVECVFLAVWAVLYLICGIMAATWSNKYSYTSGSNAHSAYGATSFFCFAAALVYGICAYLFFGRWRVHTSSTTVTVTERHTSTATTGSRY